MKLLKYLNFDSFVAEFVQSFFVLTWTLMRFFFLFFFFMVNEPLTIMRFLFSFRTEF
jgi:hypothetical protein